MADPITIKEWANSLPSLSSLTNQSLLVKGSSGEIGTVADLRLLLQRLFVAAPAGNMDERLTPGLYVTGSTTTGTYPQGGQSEWMYCMLEVFAIGSDIVHRLTRYNAKGVAIRYYDTVSKDFKPWVEISS